MDYDFATIIGSVVGAVIGTHTVLAKLVVEPMLDKKLNAQSEKLLLALVPVKAFEDYKLVDQREHDSIQKAVDRVQARLDHA